MFVINDLNNIPVSGGAVCLGNFDGFHLGHKLIVETLKDEAAKIGGETIVFTFYPHPFRFFGKDIKLLTTRRKRLELFEIENINYLVNAPFNQNLSSLSPEDFFKNIIVDSLKAKVVVVGTDYHFGAKKAGDITVLAKLGEKYGVKCVFVDKKHDPSGLIISSSNIRNFISTGDVLKAAELLGRYYSLEGTVIKGDGKGKGFGFPTINMETENELIPTEGVYTTETLVGGKIYNSMTYIGNRPTIGKGLDLRIETNIFNFNEDIYGKFVEVFFKDKIRGEMKFNNVEELKAQMNKDLSKAKNWTQNHLR